MFRLLKGLRKEKEPPADIGIGELSPWIGREEEKVRAELARIAAGHREVFLDARGRLELVLSEFDTASAREGPSAKLTGVTERSLPLFLKTMRTSLLRDLPPDPEGFYTAAGEVLKGCLSALRGQGRYLASRFPEEMKLLRQGLDTMGGEVNALTPEIARGRERLGNLADLRRIQERYEETKRRASLGKAEVRSLEDGLARSAASLEEVRRTLAGIEQGEEYRAVKGEIARIQGLREELEQVAMRFRATAAPAVQLMKKCEKIASRKKERDAIHALHAAILFLDGDLPLPKEGAPGGISLGLKTVTAMADSGELTLKSREEGGIIHGEGPFVREVLDLSGRFRELNEEIYSAQGALQSLPAFARSRDLKGRAEDLENDMARMKDRLGRRNADAGNLERQARSGFDVVRQKVSELSGNSVRIGGEDPQARETEPHG